MQKVEQNKEKKRRAILKAAEDIFLSQGYLRASMDNIATQATVTKQTVYRYYPSKIDLFKAMLLQMGERSETHFLTHLQRSDPQQALYQFAKGFIQAHLTDEHLATYKLLLTESAQAPEIIQSFYSVGPDVTEIALGNFFSERLGITKIETRARLWTAMLLAHRSEVLMGMDKPSDLEIEKHAQDATGFLLATLD